MKEYMLTNSEKRFADLIWDREPVGSTELVKICEQEFDWKKSTTYTMLKKLCEKGIFKNEHAVVSAQISREEFYGRQSRDHYQSFSQRLLEKRSCRMHRLRK